MTESSSNLIERISGLLNDAGKWSRRNFWGVVTIVVVSIGSVFFVQTFKKPGQMTVLEANVMDMSAMMPPRGAMPVGLARAEETGIEGTITYTGSVAAFEDEDVYPRITGRIVEIPVYPGDRVKKGQLLVQLDPESSEYESRAEAAQHAAESAMHFAGSAKADFEQKKYELEAAEEAEEAAKKAVSEVKADLDYWSPEIKRQENLLKDDVVSQEEYDSELAKYRAANARFEKAQASLRQATKTRLAAKAAFQGAVHHVGHQFSASQEAQAGEKTAKIINKYRDIVARDSGVVVERVISPGVVVNPGMVVLRVAHIDKVRIQAEISNADISKVKLGASVHIKGAEGSPETVDGRVTSIFPAADKTSRTSVVEALIENQKPTPGIRSNGREVVSATEYRFLPGQYVIMSIVTGDKTGLTVPTRAVFRRGGKPFVWLAVAPGEEKKPGKYQCPMHPDVISDQPGECPKCGMKLERVDHKEHGGTKPKEEKRTYTCTMHPEVRSDKPGKCPKCGMDLTPTELSGGKIAQLISVKTGLTNSDRTEIVEGLEVGDEVVVQGFEDLQPTMPLIGVEWTDKEGIEKLPMASEVATNRLDKGNRWQLEQMVDHLMISISMKPIPPKSKENRIEIKLEKHGGGKVSGAQITGTSSMPSMDMKGPDLKASRTGNGYKINTDFHSGLWNMDLLIKGVSREPVRLSIDVEVP